ncbi:MAG TPA: phytanoyl-CoA dioxygenase family protein [Rhodospirillales bacterium]|jgi:ectoine hydroxylase-related dioxygenase (phytanoyl-CoA dioxygenase family)
MMPKRLTDVQVRTYSRDGFVHPVRVISAAEAANYRRRFEAYERKHGDWYELSKGQKLYLLQTWVAELASHAAVLDAVEDVLGSDVMVWGTSLFVKEARDRAFVSWHQDSTYWGLSKPDVVTVWIALSPATRASGCMKMIPSSHAWDQIPHRDTFDARNLLTRGQEIEVEVDEANAVFLELQPGEASLHNIRTVHGSEPNRADDRRIGVAVRYIAPHVQQMSAEGDSAWLVRGVDRFDHFIHEAPPAADMDEAARAEHARIMALRQGVLYKNVKGKPAHL